MKDIDFERVVLLIDVLDRCRPHGPTFNLIIEEAQKELNDIMADMKNFTGRIVTPPDGPANSAVQNKDGTYTRIPPAPVRGAEETVEEFRLRQDAHGTQMDQINKNSSDGDSGVRGPTNPRPNERGPGDTRTTEQVNKDYEQAHSQDAAAKKAEADRVSKPNQPNRPTEQQQSTKAAYEAEVQRRLQSDPTRRRV